MATRKLTTDHEHLWDLSPVWGTLSATERNLVDLHLSIHQFKKNQLIHYEGDEPTHMMVLIKGKVKVYKEGVGNRNQIVRMLKPFEHFGYRAIIAGEQYNTNVCAFEPSIVYMLPKDVFLPQTLVRQTSALLTSLKSILEVVLLKPFSLSRTVME